MADLAQFDTKTAAESGVRMPLHNAKGELVEGMSITVAGADSDRVMAVTEKHWDDRRNSGRRTLLPSSAEAKNNRLEVAIAATLGWEGFEEGADALECTPENVRKVYKKYPAIMRRVVDFMDDEANFTKAAAKT